MCCDVQPKYIVTRPSTEAVSEPSSPLVLATEAAMPTTMVVPSIATLTPGLEALGIEADSIAEG
jgi:hypothetical protein